MCSRTSITACRSAHPERSRRSPSACSRRKKTSIPTPCGIVSPPTCSKPVLICAPFSYCWFGKASLCRKIRCCYGVVAFGCGYLATTTALVPGGHAMRLFALQSGQDTSRATSGASVLIISFITLNGAAQAMQSKSRSNFCLPSIPSPRQWPAPR